MKILEDLKREYTEAKNIAELAWAAYDISWENGDDNVSATTLAAIEAEDVVEATFEAYQEARKIYIISSPQGDNPFYKLLLESNETI